MRLAIPSALPLSIDPGVVTGPIWDALLVFEDVFRLRDEYALYMPEQDHVELSRALDSL